METDSASDQKTTGEAHSRSGVLERCLVSFLHSLTTDTSLNPQPDIELELTGHCY